jgi:uncharacterized membrane protein YjgN (DUF898 family)
MGLGLVLGIVLFLPATLLIVGLGNAAGASPGVLRVVSTVLTAVLYAVSFSVIHGYTQARNLNEVFGATELGPHRFRSSLSAGDLIGIYLGNSALIVLTLGLYTPWAQIRLARYRLEAVELEAHGSLDEFAAAGKGPVPAAAGEEIGSFFDLDFGF